VLSKICTALLIAASLASPSFARAAAHPLVGKAFQSSQDAGKVILIDVSAAWCSICKQQRPIVQEIEKSAFDCL
jgi:thiol-disulfide isomerase/thioredoxin